MHYKKDVFSLFLKMCNDGDFLMSTGSWFQRCGEA